MHRHEFYQRLGASHPFSSRLCGSNFRHPHGGAFRLEEVFRIELKDVEHGAESLELAHENGIVRAVDLGGELEHRGDGERGKSFFVLL